MILQSCVLIMISYIKGSNGELSDQWYIVQNYSKWYERGSRTTFECTSSWKTLARGDGLTCDERTRNSSQILFRDTKGGRIAIRNCLHLITVYYYLYFKNKSENTTELNSNRIRRLWHFGLIYVTLFDSNIQ